jgi:hypothetical protein
MIVRPAHASLSIAWTMVIAFVMSFLFMLWERSASQRTVQTGFTEQPRLFGATFPVAPRPTQALAPATRAGSGAAAESAGGAPLLIVVRNRRRLDEVEATAQNTSDRALSVTLVLEDGEGGIVSRARLELQPGEARRIGANDGIDLPRGGKIRVTTPGYVDRVVDIPL